MKYKNIALVAVLFGITLLISGCGQSPSTSTTDSGERLKIAGTIYPVYDLVRTVGGDHVDAKLILPSGTSPHVFEPTPQTLKSLQDTKLVFAIGHELDSWVEGIVKNISTAEQVTLDHGISLMKHAEEKHEDHDEDDDHEEDEHKDEHEDEHEDHAHGEFDPHYWLSPTNAIVMIEEIEEHLSEVFPEYKDVFEQNAEELINELKTKDALWKKQLGAKSNKNLVTLHSAFGYLAKHFGLHVVATFEEFPGKEPTPKYLANLQEEIEEHSISALYIEPQLSKASLESFARDNNIRIGVLDPLGGAENRMTYIELLDYNVQEILRTN